MTIIASRFGHEDEIWDEIVRVNSMLCIYMHQMELQGAGYFLMFFGGIEVDIPQFASCTTCPDIIKFISVEYLDFSMVEMIKSNQNRWR